MGTYKLIKIFPGLPPDWKVGIKLNYNKEEKQIHSLENTEYFMFAETNYMKDFPEYFQPIDDFEILKIKIQNEENSVLTFENGICVHRTDDISPSITYTVQQMIEKGVFENEEILSVKRYSDGEIFTIGDRLESKTSSKPYHKISKFYLQEKEGYVKGLWIKHSTGACHLNNSVKLKLRFTTKDGKDIYKGDSFFWVRKSATDKTIHTQDESRDKHPHPGFLYFSTANAAVEELKMDAPEFSRNQVIKFLKSSAVFSKLETKDKDLIEFFQKHSV